MVQARILLFVASELRDVIVWSVLIVLSFAKEDSSVSANHEKAIEFYEAANRLYKEGKYKDVSVSGWK